MNGKAVREKLEDVLGLPRKALKEFKQSIGGMIDAFMETDEYKALIAEGRPAAKRQRAASTV